MKNRIKQLTLEALSIEGYDIDEITAGMVDKVVDVSFSREENYVKIKFLTTTNKEAYLLVKLDSFNSWMKRKKEKLKDTFKYFVVDFITNSKEEEGLNEIVDDDNNIIGDDDMPNNSTNSMVTSPKFDLEKIFKDNYPKRLRFYMGDNGYGAITW